VWWHHRPNTVTVFLTSDQARGKNKNLCWLNRKQKKEKFLSVSFLLLQHFFLFFKSHRIVKKKNPIYLGFFFPKKICGIFNVCVFLSSKRVLLKRYSFCFVRFFFPSLLLLCRTQKIKVEVKRGTFLEEVYYDESTIEWYERSFFSQHFFFFSKIFFVVLSFHFFNNKYNMCVFFLFSSIYLCVSFLRLFLCLCLCSF